MPRILPRSGFALVCLWFLLACDAQEGDDTVTDAQLDTSTDAGDALDAALDGSGGDAGDELDAVADTLEPPPTCDVYCDTVMASCAEANAQYDSREACVTFCEGAGAFAAGISGATSGNSVACRTYHAEAAAESDSAAAMHCEHAGPSGGNMCGTWCDNYCDRALRSCTGESELYADRDACVATCIGFNDEAPASSTGGDSVQCRIYHLGVAGTDALAAEMHCPHATVDGGGVCVDAEAPVSCASYCAEVMAACTGALAQYGSEGSCLTFCESYSRIPLGSRGATAGNSFACREYHANVASTDAASAEAHCPHSGPSGGDVCGSWCETYCDMSLAICTDDNAQYADRDECLSTCELFPDNGAQGDTGGNTVQCRLYHLGAAGVDAISATTHCPHTGADGGGVCVD